MKRALIKYHHGLGDVIQLTPHLRHLYEDGYVTDIMGMAQNRTSHLLDECPYISDYFDIPNTWKSPLGFQAQLHTDIALFLKLSINYDWSGMANHIGINHTNKINFTSNELKIGLFNNDKTVEVFIPKKSEKKVSDYIEKFYPNGYVFVHTQIEEHTYHNWDAIPWIRDHLSDLPIIDSGYGGEYYKWTDNINDVFVLAREATHRVLSSSVMVHACDAMDVGIDVVNYGRPDRKIWLQNMGKVNMVRENGIWIN